MIHAETAAVGWTIAVAELLTAAIPADPGLRDRSPESTQAFDQVAPEPPAAACAGHEENMAAFNGAFLTNGEACGRPPPLGYIGRGEARTSGPTARRP